MNQKILGRQTHQPLLYHFIPKTNKPILEIGMGLYSTPLICEEAGENLVVSLETNNIWYKKFRNLQREKREMVYIRDYDKYDVTQHDWGIVFIDHRPPGHRAVMINRLANLADYLIIHDTEPCQQQKYVGMEEALNQFKYRFDDKTGAPGRRDRGFATVVSNKYELDLNGFTLRYT